MAEPKDTPAPKPKDETRANADWDDDKGEDWRHAPVAPKDAGILDSLGKSISETVTGADADRTKGPKT